MREFDAYRIHDDHGTPQGRLERLTLDDLGEDAVTVRGAYSSVNYKDALAATGARKVIQRFPLVGGVDMAGTVVSSTSPRVSVGEDVIVSGYGMGVSHDGGFSGYARVPAEWVVPLPEGLSPYEAMVVGMAGFTAGLSILRMEQNGLDPAKGPVIVTGATGGVGSIAVEILAQLGYEVTALTGKDEEHEYLRSLGASEVLSRHTLVMGTRPLERSTWAGAVDPVGGEILAWLTRTTKRDGCIANSGLTAGVEFTTTVLPFILRGISLLGIDATMCDMKVRREVWKRLSEDMKPADLVSVAEEIDLQDLPDAFSKLLAGQAKGRMVVRLRT